MKKQSKAKTFFKALGYLETGTWIVIGVTLMIITCLITSCFVKVVEGNFFFNAVAIILHGVAWLFGGIIVSILIYGVVSAIYNAVNDFIDSYKLAKIDDSNPMRRDNMTNTGFITGNQTVLTAPYTCVIRQRPLADGKTAYETGDTLFVITEGILTKTLTAPKNLVVTKLLVEPDTLVPAGEVLAIYEETVIQK